MLEMLDKRRDRRKKTSSKFCNLLQDNAFPSDELDSFHDYKVYILELYNYSIVVCN
jgi:hypothetical protein